MKIGIFTSGLENLSLLKVLKLYNIDIVVYINQDCWPLEEKTLSFQQLYIEKGINKLLSYSVDKIILHPLWEIKYKNEDFIFPLYQNLVNQTLKYSIVGKIGLFGNLIDLNEIEKFLLETVKDYTLTPRQLKNKKFNNFIFYKKDISIWKYNIMLLGKRNWLIRKILKTDLRFFLNCNVDSILPTTYDIFHVEHIIKQKIKKIHFQTMNKWSFLDDMLPAKNNKYKLSVIGDGNLDSFLKIKKWQIWLK